MSNEFGTVLSKINNRAAKYVNVIEIRGKSGDHRKTDVFKATRPVRPAGNL